MDHAEFLVVFVSIILGFNLAEYLKGISVMVKRRRQLTGFFPLHFWQGMILLMMIQWWWALWLYKEGTTESMGSFLLVLSIPMLYALAISFLIPTEGDLERHEGKMRSYFVESSRMMYLAIALIYVAYSATGLLWLDEEWLHPLIGFRLLVTLVCLHAAFSPKVWADYLAMLTLAANMVYMYIHRFFEIT